MNNIDAKETNYAVGLISLPILWSMMVFVIVLITVAIFFSGGEGLCDNDLLAQISTQFNVVTEVKNLSEESVIGCQISLGYGLALSCAPLFGLLVNFSKIDRTPLYRIDIEKSCFNKCLSFTFILLLGLAPYTFASSDSLPHQFSFSFFQVVRSSREVLYIFSIGTFFFLTAVWTFIIFKIASFLGVK